MDDTFGYWLAGYIDGEGHFGCNVYGKRRSVIKGMTINARADDKPLLELCQQQTGLGKLHFVPAKAGSRPGWRWVVASTRECLALVEILEKYPLRSKKQRDFVIWSEIIRTHALFKRPGRGTHVNDYGEIERLSQILRTTREYDSSFEKEL